MQRFNVSTIAAACAAAVLAGSAYAYDGCEKLTPDDRATMSKTALVDRYCLYRKRQKERERIAETTNASMRTLVEGGQCKKEADKIREVLEGHFEIKDPKCSS